MIPFLVLEVTYKLLQVNLILKRLPQAMELTKTSLTPQQVSTEVRQNLLTCCSWEGHYSLRSPRLRNKHSKYSMVKVQMLLSKGLLCSIINMEDATPLLDTPTCTSSIQASTSSGPCCPTTIVFMGNMLLITCHSTCILLHRCTCLVVPITPCISDDPCLLLINHLTQTLNQVTCLLPHKPSSRTLQCLLTTVPSNR
jgi:hypothetical protein